MILSTIDFCLEILGEDLNIQYIVKVALKGALREYLGIKGRQDAHVDDLLAEAGWLNIYNKWRKALIRSMNKVLRAME